MSHTSRLFPNRLFIVATLCLTIMVAVACATPSPVSTTTPPPSPTHTPVTPPPPTSTASPATQPPSSPSAEEPIAILTLVEGDVTVSESIAGRVLGLASLQAGRWARPFDLLRPGTTLTSKGNGRATAVCFNNRYFRVEANTTVRVGQQCQVGSPLPKRSAARVKPDAGRIAVVAGSLILQEEVREQESDYGRIPIILGPRNTRLLNLEPELRWVEIPGAIEYVLHLSDSDAFNEITLEAEKLSCIEDVMTAPNRVCSASWPASQWRLEKGQSYFLTISARTGIASRLRPSEESDLRILTDAAADEVQAAVKETLVLELDPVTRDLLLAGLYAENELYEDTIAAYKRVLDVQPSSVVLVTVGDTYRKTALYRWAFDAYEKALALLSQDEGDLAFRAAAEFGVGQVYYNYAGNYSEAGKHYAEAVQLYTQLGAEAEEELRAAQTGLKECEQRTRP